MPALTKKGLGAALVLSGLLAIATVAPASADRDQKPAPPPPPPPTSPSGTLSSLVHYSYSKKTGTGTRMHSTSGTWSPPPCWYEPRFSPQEFKDYLISNWRQGSAFTEWADEYKSDDYHVGDKGTWYYLAYDQSNDSADIAQCAGEADFVFIGPTKPAPPGAPVIDAKTLAGLAYNRTGLPQPPLTLRPVGANQLVNVDTEVAFTAPLRKVWVTARFDNAALGIHVAATTVAVPAQLRVDAGTDYAEPRTCTYDLTGTDGTYSVDTRHDACNVTYRKASPAGGYPLRASIVWKVTWTASADPDGAPETAPGLPDGESAAEFVVTVRENQAVVRPVS